MEHYKAATSVISSLQQVAGICQNDSVNTISSHIEQVRWRESSFIAVRPLFIS